MYPECVAFLRKPMGVREIVVLVRLSLTLMVLRKNATHSGYMGRHPNLHALVKLYARPL